MDRSDKIMAWISGSLCLAMLLFLFLYLAYSEDWTATGIPGKTLWDWLQLLIVPLALALIALVFQLRLTRAERRIAQDKFQGDHFRGISIDWQHSCLNVDYEQPQRRPRSEPALVFRH